MSDGQIVIDTRLNTDEVSSGVNKIQDEAKKAGKAFDNAGEVAEREWGQSMRETTQETTQSVSTIKDKVENLSSRFSKLAKAIGVAFVVDKVKDFGKSILTAGVNFDAMKEQSIAAWTTILGSADKANNMFKEITNFAASTPFSQMGVDQMAKQLTNAGFKGQALFDQLTKFGDMGSAFSVQEDSLKEMVRQYAQVKMAGVAYTEDLNILADRSIPIYTALADVLGTNVANVKKMASQGKITSDVYDKAINKIAESTKGAMDKQSQTFSGIVSTVKDNLDSLAGTLATPIFDFLKSQLGDVGNLLEKFNTLVGKEGVSKALAETVPQLTPLINLIKGLGNILSNIVIPVIKDFFTFIAEHTEIIAFLVGTIGSLILAFKAFSIINSLITLVKALGIVFGILDKATAGEAASQMALNLAFLTNPLFLWIAGLTILVGGFIYLWNTSERFRNFWIELWNGIKNIVSICVNSVIGFFKGLINFIKNDWKQILLFLVNPFAGAFALLYKHCNSFRNFINNLGKSIIGILKQWGSSIGKFFTKTIPNALNNLGKSISTFIKSIPRRLSELGKAFINWNQQMLFKFGYFLGYALGTLVRWGVNVWNFFTKTIPQWITFVGQWFSKLPGEISKWLVDAYHKVVAWGKNMITKAIETSSNFINNFINWISQLPGRIANYLSTTYNNVVAWGSNMINKAIETASNFINNFINWVSQLPGRFGNWLSQCLNSVANWGYNLYVAGRNAAINLVNSIVDEVKSLPGKMMNLGRYIVHGLWQGILNAKNNLIADIKNFCSGIVSGFMSGLGIHSPARELIPVGKYTIQGVSVGMDNEMPNLNDQVKDQMSKMVNKMKAVVKAQTSGQSFKASFGAMHMNMNKSFKLISDNEKQPVVINLEEQHVLDGEVIAAHTTHKVIENISENQNNYLVATGGIF